MQVDPNLLVGHIGSDDAGVYRINDTTALVLTVDFFTPVVDDPYDYGRVAAANSLSDVYAMGGQPMAAMNIAGFPEGDFPATVLEEILKGGASVAGDAGIVIVGGHTVKDNEIKYGLSVVGTVHPDEIIKNSGAEVGDQLILTKPLGTGILTTALKADDLDGAFYDELIGTMTQLNKDASRLMKKFDVHACTDVTGYGLIGHGFEMASASGVSLAIDAAAVPVMTGVMAAIDRGLLTGGGKTNRGFVGEALEWDPSLAGAMAHLLFDPQTSGGLLMSVSSEKAEDLLKELRKTYTKAAVIGSVTDKTDKTIRVS